MKGWSIGFAIFSVIMIVLAIFFGINFYSNKLDEDRKAEVISLAKDVAEQYQEKKINNIESFTIEKPNKRIELSKGKDGFVFEVTFLNYRDLQIQFPASVDDGILKIEIEYPSYNEDSNSWSTFLLLEVIIILMVIISIYASVNAWKK